MLLHHGRIFAQFARGSRIAELGDMERDLLSQRTGETLLGELRRMLSNLVVVQWVLTQLVDQTRNRRDVQVLEEVTGSALRNGVEVSPSPQRESWRAERRCLQGCEPVILEGRSDQRVGVSVEPTQLTIVHVAQKVDVGRGRLLQRLPEGSGPDDDEVEVRAFREHSEDAIEVLVREEAGDHQEEPIRRSSARPFPRAADFAQGWRRDDEWPNAVHRRDLGGHRRRGRVVRAGTGSCPAVPAPKRGRHRSNGIAKHERVADRVQQRSTVMPLVPVLAEILVALVEPAGRAVAVDQLGPCRVHPMSPATRAAEHDVLLDLKLGEGMSKERRREPMLPPQRL